jgi:hypothetical protein
MKVRLFAGLAAVSLLATALSATVHAEDWHLRRK